MIRYNLLLSLLLTGLSAFLPGTFKTAQLKYARVKSAYQDKEESVKALFTTRKLDLSQSHLFIRAFKQEGLLEVWAKHPQQTTYQLVITYPVCASSGVLGPKRYGGDGQVPEGFYYIDRFNPQSNFHLSLGINYPNESDRILGEKANLGGDIFIHGSCVTIGCLPLTDDKIKELYIMTVEARSNGQSRIPVHIFPAKLTEANLNRLKQEYSTEPTLLNFWQQLKTGYAQFEASKQIPTIIVDAKGIYQYK
ncbi:L,D-transpeptidase family protein [Rhodocytophaga rosea]|uniref:L,D-transpeptidase family protein n=1 Tax=Rhodocytophaga rosea TaxID=2704465 RepID=A0A6C0GEQ7_9BACT|nr:L,D-transpeptidase family protein [Rhodocytophaga rosea]QHT66481.1 L,D-transpeptidase family protein [Rhodocytophaga rosea]